MERLYHVLSSLLYIELYLNYRGLYIDINEVLYGGLCIVIYHEL